MYTSQRHTEIVSEKGDSPGSCRWIISTVHETNLERIALQNYGERIANMFLNSLEKQYEKGKIKIKIRLRDTFSSLDNRI